MLSTMRSPFPFDIYDLKISANYAMYSLRSSANRLADSSVRLKKRAEAKIHRYRTLSRDRSLTFESQSLDVGYFFKQLDVRVAVCFCGRWGDEAS